MKRLKQILLALVIAAIPQTGHAFSPTNGFTVALVVGVVFEVSDWKNTRAPAFWCAAANYARRAQKAGWNTDV